MTTETIEQEAQNVEQVPTDPVSQRYWRQLNIMPPDRLTKYTIVVVGAGAIGSEVVKNLVKMGFPTIEVWDNDRIDEWNTSNQIYPPSRVGQKKVDALKDIIRTLTDFEITAIDSRVGDGDGENRPTTGPNTILISAVDNMETREYLWERIAKNNTNIGLFVDPRMGAEVFIQYSVNPIDPEWQRFYEDSLRKGQKPEEIPCTERAIIYTPSFAGAFVAATIKKFVMGPGKSEKSYAKEVIFNCADFDRIMVERDLL